MTFDVANQEAFLAHCEVASLIRRSLPLNPHTKHHIRSAIREASLKVTTKAGTGINRASHISDLARTKLNTKTAGEVVIEHVVPVSFMNEKVLAMDKATTLQIAEFIYTWTVLAAITREEHDLLRVKGLHDKMPEGWDGCDRFARYKYCGIPVSKISS